MVSKKTICLSFLLLLGNSYLSAMEKVVYTAEIHIKNIVKLGKTVYSSFKTPKKTITLNKNQKNAMDFFELIYCNLLGISNPKIKNTLDVDFYGTAIISIGVKKYKNKLFLIEDKTDINTPFTIYYREKYGADVDNITKENISDYSKINAHFKALQTLNKPQQ